jgi:SNF2 family DNA or RNA helicase
MKQHGELTYLGGQYPHWKIDATPNLMVRLKRIFPRMVQGRATWIVLKATDEVCRDLRWVLLRWPMKISDEDRVRLEMGAEAHEAVEETANSILEGRQYELPKGALTPAREPRDYQLQAADLALSTGRLLVADELGLGKTFTGLLMLRDPNTLPALVVCPTHLPEQWQRELEASFPELSSHILKRGTPYDEGSRLWPSEMPDVWICPYSKLAGWGDHFAGVVNCVIFDEAQELRRPGSQKYAAAARVADQAAFKMGLTATPVYNYGGEIWALYNVISPDELGNSAEFYREWGATVGNGKFGVRDPNALGHHLRAEHLLLRRTRKEVGRELPEVQRIVHSIEHDEAELDKLSGEAADLAELILRSTDRKERFVAAGDLDWKMRHATGVAKARYVSAFVRMLLESGEKVVLFGWHRDVYDIWKLQLDEYNPLLYTGSESPVQKRRAVELFTEHDHHQLLIMSLRSGAGIDGLQEHAHICVFGELDWSPGMHDQCIGRLHRDGQAEPTVAYFLVSEGGADPVIADVLNLKRMQGEPIRDPERELLEEADNTGDRVKLLAEQVLARSRRQGSIEGPGELGAAA